MKTRKTEQTTVTPTYQEIEANCKKLIRQFREFNEAADRVKADLADYANKYDVTRADLLQWFMDENYSYFSARKFAYDIIKVVREASPAVKEALAEGTISFKEARESVTVPYKSRSEKRETKYLRLLREAARDAILNKLSKEDFIHVCGVAYDYAEGIR